VPHESRGVNVLERHEKPWFEPLVRELEDGALGFAITLVHERETAEEIVQEAFTRTWASSRAPAEPPEFKRWLYRTILNLARDHSRRRTRWSMLRLWGPPPPDPVGEAERRADDAALAAALRTLSPRDRAAVHLRYFEDRSVFETAQTLGVSEENARVIVHRALARLRRALGANPMAEGVET
jgi:RNA polymerase sigma factor (sigma-70 family)